MKIIDLNILLYVINKDSPHHDTVRQWWEAAINDDEPIGLAWTVILGFLRLSTNPRVFPIPLHVPQAIACLDRWLSQPNVRIVGETEEQWTLLKEFLVETGTAGNLTTDAHLATLAIATGAKLISCDTDFARFARVCWINPLSTSS